MFQKNSAHTQGNIFEFQHMLANGMKQELLESAEYKFYELIFCNIREEYFACLYSTIESRPNAPVNCLVGALLLMSRRRWSYSELFRHIRFDLLTPLDMLSHGVDQDGAGIAPSG